MNPLLRFLGVVLASALVVAPVACDDKSKDKSEDDDGEKDDDDDDEDDDDDKKTDKGKSEGGASSGANTKASVKSPAAGAVFAHMPADCPKGRGYLNAAALLSDAEAQQVLREITTKMLSKERDADTQKAVKVLKDSGFDLATGIREAALCMPATGDDPVIGLTLSVADPIGLLEKIAASMGEEKLPVEKKGDVKMVGDDGMLFIQPAPGVIVFGKKRLAEAALEKKGEAGFAAARGQVGWFSVADAQASGEAKITRAGSNFNLWGSMTMADFGKGEPKEMEAAIRKKVLEESAELKGSPFSAVNDRLQTATFQMKGKDTIVGTMSVPTSDITALLKAAAPELGVQLGGGAPAPKTGGGSSEDPLDELLKMMRKK